jgi:hypothetical protein
VAVSHRRRGAATALLRAVDAWAKDAGARMVWVDTHVTNDAARALYAAADYLEFGGRAQEGAVTAPDRAPAAAPSSNASHARSRGLSSPRATQSFEGRLLSDRSRPSDAPIRVDAPACPTDARRVDASIAVDRVQSTRRKRSTAMRSVGYAALIQSLGMGRDRGADTARGRGWAAARVLGGGDRPHRDRVSRRPNRVPGRGGALQPPSCVCRSRAAPAQRRLKPVLSRGLAPGAHALTMTGSVVVGSVSRETASTSSLIQSA